MKTTKTDLERQVEGLAAELELIIPIITRDREIDDDSRPAVLQWLMDQGYGDNDVALDDDSLADLVQEALEQDILEITVHGKKTLAAGDDWTMTGIDVVFTIGGPHIELDTREGSVMGYWGGEKARMGVTSAVTEYFEELVGGEY